MDQPVSNPRRKHSPLFIKVKVFDIKTEEQIRDLRVDVANGDKKDWLFDLMLWATLNGKLIQISNERAGI
jgi:hypothetical protein